MAAESNNKYAQMWTLENAKIRFEDALEFAETDDTCLCLQDAIYKTGIPYSTFYQLAKDQEVLDSLKTDIKNAIIRRINKNALNQLTPSPASPSIWRMKQLGEKDEQHIKQTGTAVQKIIVADKKTAADIDEMKERFENE